MLVNLNLLIALVVLLLLLVLHVESPIPHLLPNLLLLVHV
jgi:hypothetical protein